MHATSKYKYNFINYINKITIQIIIIILIIAINLVINNKIFLWITLEISTISFIRIIIISKSFNARIIYFIISFIRRTIIFIGLLYHPSININILIIIRISIKIALFPLNYWFNLISKSINYTNLGILITLIKFIPLNIIHLIVEINQFILPVVIIRIIISPIITINKYSLKLILSYSSIHQTRIIIIIIYINFYIFILYFLLYTLITYTLILILNSINNKLKYEFNINKKIKIIYFFIIISYSYFPPITTFIIKWSLIENLIIINIQFKLISFIVILSRFIIIWRYLNFINNNIYNYPNFNKIFTRKFIMKKSQKEVFMIWIILLSSIMYIYFNF